MIPLQFLDKIYIPLFLAAMILIPLCAASVKPENTKKNKVVFTNPPLISDIFTADPSAHVFMDKLYIYPSHDIDVPAADKESGNMYNMNDYHVFSLDEPFGKVTDHGVALALKDIPWADRQLWAPDAAYANNKYYLFFPAKDKKGIFRIGVATSQNPWGVFKAEPKYIEGSYSIDPAVLADSDGSFYMYFGGLWGGQLEKWPGNKYNAKALTPTGDKPAVCPRVARLKKDLLGFAEPPKDLVITDESGQPLKGSDNNRRFFEAPWMHKYNDTYYFSWSTGDTHNLCYATSSSPYGPFKYRGVLLKPVQGWTNHHSVVEYKGHWYLFYHDDEISKRDNLRNVKMMEMFYEPDGSIRTMSAFK